MFDKRQIARQFDRSATRYESFDSLQRLMNDALLEWLGPSKTLIDLGCGSGRALAHMSRLQPESKRFALDISAGMLQKARQGDPQLQCIQADMEHLPLANQGFDLVYSCAALQWGRPEIALSEMHRILQPGGKILLGTLVAGSLREWQQAWEIAGDISRVHKLPESQELLGTLVNMGLSISRQRQVEHRFDYATPETMLQDLKGLGGTHASTNRPKGLLGKNTYRRFREALLGLGCVARYQVLLVEATLP